MRFYFYGIFFLACGLNSCLQSGNESSLDQEDIQFIRDLGLLEASEEIEMFESNGGFKGLKESGNFITDRRIASYWIEDGKKDLHWAFFKDEIDSITFTDLVSALTYASYLTVYKHDAEPFNVYVDADSVRTYAFYKHAMDNWEKLRENK